MDKPLIAIVLMFIVVGTAVGVSLGYFIFKHTPSRTTRVRLVISASYSSWTCFYSVQRGWGPMTGEPLSSWNGTGNDYRFLYSPADATTFWTVYAKVKITDLNGQQIGFLDIRLEDWSGNDSIGDRQLHVVTVYDPHDFVELRYPLYAT